VGGDVGEAAESGGRFGGVSVVSRVNRGGMWLRVTITPRCVLLEVACLYRLPLASWILCVTVSYISRRL